MPNNNIELSFDSKNNNKADLYRLILHINIVADHDFTLV